MGERKPAVERVVTNIRFDQKTREALKKLNDETGSTYQHHVTRAVREYLDRLAEKAKKTKA